mmetsp:Transcript_4605/g.13282  ORF Transcript_4605/g.13282 Transcript_4605/m.13282 type:complete len:236 (-) Transcript_4605:664-1371(-)
MQSSNNAAGAPLTAERRGPTSRRRSLGDRASELVDPSRRRRHTQSGAEGRREVVAVPGEHVVRRSCPLVAHVLDDVLDLLRCALRGAHVKGLAEIMLLALPWLDIAHTGSVILRRPKAPLPAVDLDAGVECAETFEGGVMPSGDERLAQIVHSEENPLGRHILLRNPSWQALDTQLLEQGRRKVVTVSRHEVEGVAVPITLHVLDEAGDLLRRQLRVPHGQRLPKGVVRMLAWGG